MVNSCENQGAAVEDGVVAGVVVVAVPVALVLELVVFVVLVAGGSVGTAFLDWPDGIFVPGR